MRPEDEIRRVLPPYLRPEIHARYAEVWCERCGQLVAVFQRERVTPGQVEEFARQHQCPDEIDKGGTDDGA